MQIAVRLRLLLAFLSIFACLAVPRVAAAQTPSPLAEWQYSAGLILGPMMGQTVETWSLTVGPATAMQPIYPGSDQYRLIPGAVFDLRYKDIAFLSTGEGLGVNLLHGNGYRAGVAIGFDVGRAEGDSHLLRGMGNISPSATPKLFAEYVIFPVVLRADIRWAVGGYNGLVGDVSAYLPVAGNAQYAIFLGPSVAFAGENYMGRYFGVTAAQSKASGYRQYDPEDGIRDVSFGVDGDWFFAEDWLFNADLAVKRLVTAEKSPLVAATTGFTFSLAIAYRF